MGKYENWTVFPPFSFFHLMEGRRILNRGQTQYQIHTLPSLHSKIIQEPPAKSLSSPLSP